MNTTKFRSLCMPYMRYDKPHERERALLFPSFILEPAHAHRALLLPRIFTHGVLHVRPQPLLGPPALLLTDAVEDKQPRRGVDRRKESVLSPPLAFISTHATVAVCKRVCDLTSICCPHRIRAKSPRRAGWKAPTSTTTRCTRWRPCRCSRGRSRDPTSTMRSGGLSR